MYLHQKRGVNECTHSTVMSFCLPLLRLEISDYESDAPGGHCSLQLRAKCSSAQYVPLRPSATWSKPTPHSFKKKKKKAGFTNMNTELKQ